MKKHCLSTSRPGPAAGRCRTENHRELHLQRAADGVAHHPQRAQAGRLMPIDTLTPNSKGRVKIERFPTSPTSCVLNLRQGSRPMLHLLLLPKEKVSLEVVYMPTVNSFDITAVKGSDNMALYKDFSNLVAGACGAAEPQSPMARPRQRSSRRTPTCCSAPSSSPSTSRPSSSTHPSTRRFATHCTRKADHDFVEHIDSRVRTALVAGMEAPEIEMADRDGKTRRLSDLRGKVVLIDFWASWCRPCRMENPNVVRLYGQYHDKGFEVFSVSLDNNRDAWLKAIEDDHLAWPNHVSDLRGWSSAAGRLYGIQSIPATVLVDPDGKILARNLRGKDLENKLKEIFAQ